MAIAKYAELLERPPQVSITWKAALYIRLSREDGDKAESNSIKVDLVVSIISPVVGLAKALTKTSPEKNLTDIENAIKDFFKG